LSLIFAIILFLAKKNIAMKLKSIFARKAGKILAKYHDPVKGYHEEFVYIKERTVNIRPPGSEGKLLGADPKHMYFDPMYQIRAIDLNELGSYIVDGSEAEQSFLSGDTADMFVKKALMSPKSQNELHRMIIFCLIGIAACIVISLGVAYMSYQTMDMIKTLPIVKTAGTAVSNTATAVL
jgi:hypothetical protein